MQWRITRARSLVVRGQVNLQPGEKLMISKKLMIGSLFAAAAAAVLTTGTAEVQADPILTSGVVCSHATPGQAEDFQGFTNAFVNVNPAVRLAVCAVPRSPALPAGANPTFTFTTVNA